VLALQHRLVRAYLLRAAGKKDIRALRPASNGKYEIALAYPPWKRRFPCRWGAV